MDYPEWSKGYRFYCPKYITRTVESNNAKFLEDLHNNGNLEPRNITNKEIREQNKRQDGLVVPPITEADEQQHVINDQVSDQIVVNNPLQEDTHMKGNKIVMEELRRSTRGRRSAIPNDYIVYLEETEVGTKAIESDDSEK